MFNRQGEANRLTPVVPMLCRDLPCTNCGRASRTACPRCADPLCELHRPRRLRRCSRCERLYRDRLDGLGRDVDKTYRQAAGETAEETGGPLGAFGGALLVYAVRRLLLRRRFLAERIPQAPSD